MGELKTVVPTEKIAFQGIFSIKELRDIVVDWMSTKAYVPVEEKAQQVVKKTCKFFEYKFKPYKKLSDYAKSVVKIAISASDCKDVVVTVAGKKRKMNEGKVLISVEGVLETDYEAKLEVSWLYALRVIAEKYILSPFISHHSKYVREEADQIISEFRGYFNLQEKLK